MEKGREAIKTVIESGKTTIGIELGSTRIKAVLIGEDRFPIASGSHDWENRLLDGVWTYSLEQVWAGIQDSYACLAAEVRKTYATELRTTQAIGFSAMMHGYMAFDGNEKLLVPFRTWRNNMTGRASEELTNLFDYPIPQRWTIAHLYQAILTGEAHVSEIHHLTTLAGYVHEKLTGRKVLGIGEASGVFPVDPDSKTWDAGLCGQFDTLVASYRFPWNLVDLLPEVLPAGENAGALTPEGALILDPTGTLQAGIPFCPPEGDAGTGMVATNSIAVRTGNVSAGTSVFAMIVLEKALSRAYPEIDLVMTPAGAMVAMAHSNNCSSDLDAWIALLGDAAKALGATVPKPVLYDTLLELALTGDADGGGLLAYGYLSGEHMTHFEEGRPLFVRGADSRFTLANFMRTHLFASLGALRTGLDILFEKEGVQVDAIMGHGGFFKTRSVGMPMMAAATRTPVAVLETAGEGGAWGIALLASFMATREAGETLDAFLDAHVFSGASREVVQPDARDMEGFNQFMERYTRGLAIERAAVESLS